VIKGKKGEWMEIAVLGKRSTVAGFKLAGVKNTTIAGESETELLDQFESLTENPDIGILVIDDSCTQIRQDIIQFIETNKSPIISEIPGRKCKIEEGIIDAITKRASGAK